MLTDGKKGVQNELWCHAVVLKPKNPKPPTPCRGASETRGGPPEARSRPLVLGSWGLGLRGSFQVTTGSDNSVPFKGSSLRVQVSSIRFPLSRFLNGLL